ncbi:cupin domain-containing protein [Arthrobacter sp. NPDC058127]|uniref:cupin domain-containing protein n=1 Tax=Arthrobacter sp. NPDC058127 TaxID=3346351 RepID=UPI0036EAF618
MSTKTTTKTSHYHVQKARREKYIEDWRANHRAVIRIEEVEARLKLTQRGSKIGVYMGEDGDNPTRTIDALLHEIDSGVITTIHRHSWDAMIWGVGGEGWIEIDGERVKITPGDSVHIPAWAWHRSGNDGAEAVRYVTFSSEPLMATMGFSILEDRGHEEFSTLPGRPAYTSAEGIEGDDAYARRLRRLGNEQAKRRSGRLRTDWEELEMLNTPRGSRTTFLLDRAIGYEASGITMAMFELGQGRQQSMHRHPGEAWLYVVDGDGHSYLGSETEGGENHPWKKGDLVSVDHFLWHQHFNDSKDNTARMVRVHMFDSFLDTMKAMMDPMVLFEEPPTEIRDKQAGDVNTIVWPPMIRPSWP